MPAEDLRRGRAAAENIIPQETNAAEMLMELLPELAGKISGLAMNVPVPNGSVVDLVCWHERPVTVEAINEVVRTAARPAAAQASSPTRTSRSSRATSCHSPYSGTFDSLATMVLGERVSKTLSWFDNGWGYAHRVVDLIQRFGRRSSEEADGMTAHGDGSASTASAASAAASSASSPSATTSRWWRSTTSSTTSSSPTCSSTTP